MPRLRLAFLSLLLLLPHVLSASPSVASLLSTGLPDSNGGDFDVLTRLLTSARLIDALNGGDDVTVFAPNDAAFRDAGKLLGCKKTGEADVISCLEDVFAALGEGAARRILLYHVVPKALTLDNVLKQTSFKTLEGGDITRTGAQPLELQDKAEKINNPKILATGVEQTASNGIVHAIDAVLFPIDLDPAEAKKLVAAAKKRTAPPSVTGSSDDNSVLGLLSGPGQHGSGAADSSNFDILTSLVSSSGDLANKIKTAKKVTVFAPNDAAFIQSARDLGFNDTDAVTSREADVVAFFRKGFEDGTLEKTLQYHVVEEDLPSAAVLQRTSIATLAGEDISRSGSRPIVLSDKAVNLTDPKLRVESLDQLASNGRVHQIDRVLFPAAVTKQTVAKTAAEKPATEDEDDNAATVSSRDPVTSPSPGGADDDNGSPCFPASAVVHLTDGTDLPMHALRAGDEVRFTTSEAVPHGEAHSRVYFFSHRLHEGVHEFVRVETEGRHAIVLSANHYMYANGEMVAADQVRVGDQVDTVEGISRVVEVSVVRERGLVAPHTLHGDIVVGGIRASTYTRSVHPTLAHFLLGPVRAVVRLGLAVEPLGELFYRGADGIGKYVPKGF